MWGIELVVMTAMIALNAVLAAFEIALASVGLARLHVLVGDGRAGAKAAAYMKENVEGSLAGVQLGITLVGAVAAATGGAGAEGQLAPNLREWLGVSPGLADVLAVAAVVLPLTVVTIVLGELVPKVFALRNREWVCLRLSPVMKWFVTAVWPVVWALEAAATGLAAWGERRLGGRVAGLGPAPPLELQELRAVAALARTSRLIGRQEEQIILGAAGLTSLPVRQVMRPADAMCMLDANQSATDALAAAHLDMHTRYPVTERPGDPQGVVGYVNFKDIVAHSRLAPHDPSLLKVIRPILGFPADAPVSGCLERLVREHVHIALVREPDARVAGMVTMEDMLEELVGEIEDEFDSLPDHAVVSGRGWVVGGGITPDGLREATGVELPAGQGEAVRHLSEWVSRRHAGLLRGGEVIEDGGVRVAVRKVRRRNVLEARVEPRPS